MEYAETLDIPFVFASNDDGFVFQDRTCTGETVETSLALDAFPSPDELWQRYAASKGLTGEGEELVLEDYDEDGSGKQPRYYQVCAINVAIEAIAKGQNRVLLVMATGITKTYTEFQIICRLWKGAHKNRVLLLVDHNILVIQIIVNQFRPFGLAMAKLSANAKTVAIPVT